jgi:hypothetical protein
MKSGARQGDQYRRSRILPVLIVQCSSSALRFRVKYNAPRLVMRFQLNHSVLLPLGIRLLLTILSKHSRRRWLRHLLKPRERLRHILFHALDLLSEKFVSHLLHLSARHHWMRCHFL